VKSSAIGRYRQGDTIRTDRYRFTLYSDTKGKQIARMLYDHRADPGENINIAELPKHRKLVADLTQKLKQGMGKPSRRP
jgi:arylsulfatase A-like enzyme